MAALVFPSAPAAGQRFPADPGTPGVIQYEWDPLVGVWNIVPVFLRTNNQTAYNSYVWPNADGAAGLQLETDGAGNVNWQPAGDPTIFALSIQGAFDGVQTQFALIDPATTNVYAPTPSSNLTVFLGGVAQEPNTAYTVAGSVITFTQPPAAGTDFFAITTVAA